MQRNRLARKQSQFKGTIKNQKGVALLMALVFVMIMTFLAVELGYDINVEYLVSNSELQNLRAYYAAKSGVELSLLRIMVYEQAMKQFKSQLGSNAGMLDLIWQFPFSWPPMMPDETNSVDKGLVKEKVAKSLMDATYSTNISAEGSKIDINDLGSPFEPLAKSTKEELMQLFENRIKEDDDWARDHRDFRFEELLGNIADWVSKGDVSKSGGTKSTAYNQILEKRSFSGVGTSSILPGEPFKTIDELHMVAGMTDDIFNFLVPHITIYGAKAINVNFASKLVLMSIDPAVTSEVADQIISGRQDPNIGPFGDEEKFKSFLASKGVAWDRFNPNHIPLAYSAEYNFRIKSVGQFGKARREIVAIVYDFDTVKERLKTLVVPTPTPTIPGTPAQTPQTPAQSTTPAPAPTPTSTPAAPSAPSRPNVIFWNEI